MMATMSAAKTAATKQRHVLVRRADKRDAEVGQRVRSRRLELQLSQTELAGAIGVTFQQVQKYEKGVNRIGAGRLQRLAEALKVPVSFFFDNVATDTVVSNKPTETIFGMMQSRGSVKLVKAFNRISSPRRRNILVELIENIADAEAA